MWINGQPGEAISATDRGLLYGDGLFETILISHSRAILLDEHLRRLAEGCERLALNFPEQLRTEIPRFLEAHKATDGVLKVILTRGPGGRGYRPPEHQLPSRILQWHQLPPDIDLHALRGIQAMFCRHLVSRNPSLAGLKHLNRLDQVMASAELLPDTVEGLMSDENGSVIEGTRSNIFAVIEGLLCTPDLSYAGVRGVLRDSLITRLRASGIEVSVRDIPGSELMKASEIFICNSVIGVWPVVHLRRAVAEAGVSFPIGPKTCSARQLWSDILAS